MIAHGTVHKYGDNVDTDVIIPARYLNTANHAELAAHCMEDIDRDFTSNVKKGDIIVGGANFGCGSSREHAPIAIKEAGISVVIAKTFARIFYRNAINLGLPLIVCKNISKAVQNGQTLTVDILGGTIRVEETGAVLQAEALGGKAMEILQSGGIKPLMRQYFEKHPQA